MEASGQVSRLISRRNNGDWNCHAEGKHGTDLGCCFNVQLAGLADELDVGGKEKRSR